MATHRVDLSGTATTHERSTAALEAETPGRLRRKGVPCRVLIVEDDMLIALDLQQTVEELGAKVVGCAAHTVEAVGLAVKHRPDVVLMDIRLSGGSDGVDAAERIRRLQQVPIIFITGNTDPGTRSRVDAFGGAAMLYKPVDHAKLCSLLQERCCGNP